MHDMGRPCSWRKRFCLSVFNGSFRSQEVCLHISMKQRVTVRGQFDIVQGCLVFSLVPQIPA